MTARIPLMLCLRDIAPAEMLGGQSIIVHTADETFIRPAADAVRRRNNLHALWYHASLPLSAIEPSESWNNVPLMVECPCMGDFRRVRERLAALRSPGITVFFPSSSDENYTSINILASLGVRCGMIFTDAPVAWERLNDLLHYAVYSKANHAAVEPFDTLLRCFDPFEIADFDAVYHNSPYSFLHLSSEGKIALSAEDAAASDFIGRVPDDLGTIEQHPAYQSRINAWQRHFLDFDECSCCPAWRMCGGRFSSSLPHNPGCKDFFAELLVAAEHVAALQPKKPQQECPSCR